MSEKTLWEVRGIILCLMHIKRLYVNTLIIKYNYQDNRVRAFRDGKLKINADFISIISLTFVFLFSRAALRAVCLILHLIWTTLTHLCLGHELF